MNKRKKFILLTVVYEVVLFAVCLLLALLSKKHTEAMTTFSVILFCLLGVPPIVMNDYFYELSIKENRKKLKDEKEETKHKNELLRAEFDLPDYIETQYDNRLVTKPRLIVAIILLAIGFIVTIGSGITFSLLEYENNMLEILLIVLGLAIVIYSFFIAFNKPFWGIVHSTVPFVFFFALPVILSVNNIIKNDIILAVSGLGSGIVLYTIFLILTVIIPRKRIKVATDEYIKVFETKNKGYKHSKFNGALHNSYHVSTWFYNRNNGKVLTIFTDDDTNCIVITSNLRYGKYLLKYVPIVFEENVKVNKNIIQKIMDE